MQRISNEQLLNQLRWRYAVKKFDPTRRIPAADWKALEEAIILTPSSYGLQPWKFFVVTSPEVKAKLPPESWGQSQVNDASHVVVLAVRRDMSEAFVDSYMARMAEVRGQGNDMLKKIILGSASKMTPEMILQWNTHQVYIALGNLMTSAAMLGIDSCPMEGITPDRYDEILGIGAQGYRTIVACPLGYRAEDDKYAKLPKVRFDAADVVQYL